MARLQPSSVLAGVLWLACAPAVVAQQAGDALVRAFKAGDVQHYRVTLTVRSEVQGQRPAQVGQQTYAEPFTDSAEATLTWEVTRLIASIADDGAAQIEEGLRDFSALLAVKNREGEQNPGAALMEALMTWTRQLHSPLRYRETKLGQIQGLGDDAGPVFDDTPPVLTLWLRRALRPTSPLPNRPAREGERWQEPRAVRLPPWSDVHGTETGEWLAGPSPEISVVKLITLHTVQQISGSVPQPAAESGAAVAEKNNAPTASSQGRFHAESLNTLVHLGSPLYGGYGGLHSATRSASREVTRVVEGVPNLTEAPVFRARLSVEVRISVIE